MKLMEGLDKSKSHSSLIGVSLNKYEAADAELHLSGLLTACFVFQAITAVDEGLTVLIML